jgi:hypothetical protein
MKSNNKIKQYPIKPKPQKEDIKAYLQLLKETKDLQFKIKIK